jgi:hypothetical protein
VFNLKTNTVVESCDVTFDKSAPCPRDVVECLGDKEMEERIFIDEELHSVDGDKDDTLHPFTLSPEPVPASTLEAKASQTTTSFTAAVEASRLRGRSSLTRELPLTFRRHIHLNRPLII